MKMFAFIPLLKMGNFLVLI